MPRASLHPRRAATRVAAALATLAVLTAPAARAQANATTPRELTAYSTLFSAGFEWRIDGDDDRDCAVTLEYRRIGDLAWRPAQPLHRVEHGIWTHGEDPGNLLAGSLFFLEPGTTYQARLTLADPDGGAEQRHVTVTTRTEPRASARRTLYVVPGAGGGTGTAGDPFRGLAAADAAAQPGDLFLLQAGTYAGRFDATRDGTAADPIVFRGVDPATVVLDGGGGTDSTSNCVRLRDRRHVFLERLTLVNALIPVNADRSVGVVVRGCAVQPVNRLLDTEGIRAARSQDLFIADNTVLMPGQWEAIGRTGAYGTGGYGILIEGTGHVVCHNRIVEAWDAISVPVTDTAVPAVVTSNVDIHDNLVDRASDDGVQADAVHHNVRVFRNRLMNVGSAVSFQPIFGGPGYVLFNEIYNTRIEPYKFHQETFYGWTQETSGIRVFHNTSICNRQGWNETGIWRHATFRNNLVLGGRLDNPTLILGSSMTAPSFDFDGYNRVQGTPNLVRIKSTSYANLPAFFAATGHEQRGVELSTSAFVNAPLPHHPEWNYPSGYGAPYTSADFDLRLAAGSAALDRGTPLANVDDGFAGAAPDLGCHEHGAPLPEYGPRAGASPPLDVPVTAAAAVLSVSPNPTRGATTLRFTLPARGRVVARVLDVRGARVRDLLDAERAAGVQALPWDGRDARGRRVAPGVYVVEVVAGGRLRAGRVAVLD
jgi:hypothetical protein